MTCTARSTSGYGGFVGISARGQSESARDLDRKLTEVICERDRTAFVQLSKFRTLRQIREVAAECSQPDWGGNNELPIDVPTANEAVEFLAVLPLPFASAEISPEPLGAVAFEWRFAPARTMVVSVSGRGILEYAGLVGRNFEFHGRVAFTGELPEMILQHLISTRGR